MNYVSALAIIVVPLALVACGEAGSRDLAAGSDEGEVVGSGVAFDPETEGLCEDDDEELTLIARRIDCAIPPPAPCTLKTNPFHEYSSGAIACPADSIRVEVEQTGIYEIELVVVRDGQESRMCLDSGPVTFEAEDITGEVTLDVEGFSDGPC